MLDPHKTNLPSLTIAELDTLTRAAFYAGLSVMNMAHEEADQAILAAVADPDSEESRKTADRMWQAMKMVYMGDIFMNIYEEACRREECRAEKVALN